MNEFGLCNACRNQKVIVSGRGSKFSMCGLGLTDPDWPKYPRMPVLQCTRFEKSLETGSDQGAVE